MFTLSLHDALPICLAPRGKVSMAGVTIGAIESIELDTETFQARVVLAIDAGIDNIPADSAAVIRTSGLLGDQYIDISVGGDLESLSPGDTFYSTQSAMNLERPSSNVASGRCCGAEHRNECGRTQCLP